MTLADLSMVTSVAVVLEKLTPEERDLVMEYTKASEEVN